MLVFLHGDDVIRRLKIAFLNDEWMSQVRVKGDAELSLCGHRMQRHRSHVKRVRIEPS